MVKGKRYDQEYKDMIVDLFNFCVCIAYSYIISLGVSCTKDKKNNLLGAAKNIKGKKFRIYSLFTTGIKWFKRSYYSCRKKYHLKTCFTIYQG